MNGLHVICKQALDILAEKGLTLSTAESCTGGLIAYALTSVPGASRVFLGGVVAYANHVKTNILGVNDELIYQCGAVDSNVAVQMAEGVRRALGSSYAVSTTGIAGPEGGTIEKPVGLVYIGISCCKRTIVEKLLLNGDRDTIRNEAAKRLLMRLVEVVTADEFSNSY